jgi:ABC-2 type transport system ATP-binding protein
MTEVIAIQQLRKTYRVGFFRKPVEAVRGVSFAVKEGEIVGLVGPNGSGKTTTMKVLLGLCAPTAGAAKVRGVDARDPKSREGLGFMPENPYVYPYLTPREFVDLCARLSGVDGEARRKRVPRVLERTGIAFAADRPVRRLSKGMLQRTALAAALVGEPSLLVLDEPMSGLDPLGRREVRDLIFEERREGRTVLFSSHVLSDVETLCDRVVILRKGEVVVEGAVSELVRRSAMLTEVTLRLPTNPNDSNDDARAGLKKDGKVVREIGDEIAIEVEGEANLQSLLRKAMELDAQIVSAVPQKDSLEDLFVRNALVDSTTD